MLVAAVGMAVVLVTGGVLVSISVHSMGAVGVHAGGVEAGLGGVLMGMVAIVSVLAIVVAVLTSFGVRVAVASVCMVALTVAPAGRKRNGERDGKESSKHRRGPVTDHSTTSS